MGWVPCDLRPWDSIGRCFRGCAVCQTACFLPLTRLRVHARFDRKLLGKRSSCAWNCIKSEVRRMLDRQDVVPGMIAAIQTFGQWVQWRPHIHSLVSCGAFTRRRRAIPDARRYRDVAQELPVRDTFCAH